MSNAEWCLAGVTVVGLILWARGCHNRSAGSCALGLLLGIVAVIAYFVAFSLTRTSYLAVFLLAPFIVVLVLFRSWSRTTPGKALAAIVIVLIRMAVSPGPAAAGGRGKLVLQ